MIYIKDTILIGFLLLVWVPC